MTTETTAPMTAEQITARGNEIAPLDFGQQEPVAAAEVARWLAYHAQRRWTRNLSRYFDGNDPATRRAFHESVGAMYSEFAALHLLMVLSAADEAKADEAATRIRDAWDDGGLIGELLYEHEQALGIDPEEVTRLEEAWQALPGTAVPAAPESPADASRRIAPDIALAYLCRLASADPVAVNGAPEADARMRLAAGAIAGMAAVTGTAGDAPDSAEARLAAVEAASRAHLGREGSCCPHFAEDILAIVSGEGTDRG